MYLLNTLLEELYYRELRIKIVDVTNREQKSISLIIILLF